MTSPSMLAIDDTSEVIAEDHWAQKGDVKLYMHRKYKADTPTPRPVLVLVHGSSQAARTSVDLDVPGYGEYSVMKTFARFG
jgi:enterochelin esterase-like enzyme